MIKTDFWDFSCFIIFFNLQEGVSLNEQVMKDLGLNLGTDDANSNDFVNSELSDGDMDGSIESPDIEDGIKEECFSEVDVEPCK